MNDFSTFLSSHGLTGIVTGACTFLIIGIFHPVVIKCYYYFGTRCWWWFLLLGIGAGALSMAVDSLLLSTVLGVVAFSSLWTIKEIFEQRDRVAKGWFPANPNRPEQSRAGAQPKSPSEC